MEIQIYKQLLVELTSSASTFDGVSQEVTDEIQEDIHELLDVIDITKHKSNIDGTVTSLQQLFDDLKTANKNNDKQRCIEAIGMIRGSIMDIESAFSNTADSMEKLLVSIRDA